MVESSSCWTHPGRDRLTRRLFSFVVLTVAVALFSVVATAAFAGQASSGELLFYPCTSCHPVRMIPGTQTPDRALPNGFKGHEIVLQGHDVLGKGTGACLVCHDDPTRNPGMLKTADGSLVPITGDVAKVCYRCHSTKYKEWLAGTHGKHKPSCVAAGCHDPHTPQYMFASQLMPFTGTGWQFTVLSSRQPFQPLMGPPLAPATVIPAWFTAIVFAGLVAAAVLVGRLIKGRLSR